jgi:hypothetical protein
MAMVSVILIMGAFLEGSFFGVGLSFFKITGSTGPFSVFSFESPLQEQNKPRHKRPEKIWISFLGWFIADELVRSGVK